jgi:hypothetical protein
MNITDQLRRLGFKPDQIATALVDGKPLANVKDKPKRSDGWPGFKSKWEAMLAAELEDQKRAGEILDWEYEPNTLHLTDPCIVDGKKVRAVRYTPDFCCWLPNGGHRYIEVKGFRRTKDINRFKQAKDKFRHDEFIMLTRKNGAWEQLPY